MKVITLLLVSSLLLLVPPVIAQVANDQLIVPGQSIGKWTLAMTVDDMVKMSGSSYTILEANELSKENPDLRLSLRAYCWGSFHASFRDPKRIDYLEVDGSQFKTREGPGVFSPRSAVEAAYGKPTAITNMASGVTETTRLIYDKNGIAFQLDSTGLVTRIVVLRPGTAKTFWKF